MIMDDNDGQMIFGDLGGLKLLTFVLQGRKNPEKNHTQETCPDRGSNPGPLRDKCACYHLLHSGGPLVLSLEFFSSLSFQHHISPTKFLVTRIILCVTRGRILMRNVGIFRIFLGVHPFPLIHLTKILHFSIPLFMPFHILIHSFDVILHLIHG